MKWLALLIILTLPLWAQQPITVTDANSTDGIVAVKPAINPTTVPPTQTTAGATNANPAHTVTLSPNSGLPAIAQKTSGTGSGSQASLATSNFTNNVTAGNSLVVVTGVGNNGSVKITDTLNNSFTQDLCVANGSTFQTCIFHATNILGGTDAVTVTPSASVSLDIAAYEVTGIIGPGGGGSASANSTANQQASVDITASSSGTSTSPSSGSATTIYPNTIAFGGIGIGTANQTPSAFNPWNKDFSLAVGGSPSGLFGLHTFSQPLGAANVSVSLSATITSEPWAAAIATFRPATIAVSGQVQIGGVATVQGNLSNNGAAATSNRVGVLPGIARTDSTGGTAFTAGRDAAPDVGTDGNEHVALIPDLSLKHYRASSKFAASSTTDNWAIYGGSTEVVITNVYLTCTQTTTSTVTVQMRKFSSAFSGGTSATVTAVPIDSNKAAANASIKSYTSTGPTVGSVVGDLDDQQIDCLATGTATPAEFYMAAHAPGIPVAVLRSSSEGVGINIGNAALTGGNLTVTVEWYEETLISP